MIRPGRQTSPPPGANQTPCAVETILFDFGGVLAEEGFRNGLRAIAAGNGVDPEAFTRWGFDAVHEGGYVTGRASEAAFWGVLRERVPIGQSDAALREIILDHFRLRPWMMSLVKSLKDRGLGLAILSDQTDWLEELDRRHDFFKWFGRVFNSFRMGKSKRDPTLFDDVLGILGVAGERALFIDDDPGNIERAGDRGLRTLLYVDRKGFEAEMAKWCPFLGDGLR